MLGEYSQYRQGTFNPALNLLDNSYNIALNPGAAKFVFANYRELSSLTLVPTDTTTKVEYSLVGLRDLSPSVARRALAFNCRVEPVELITGSISVDDFPHRRIVLADLTAFLLVFTEVFEGSNMEFASVVDNGGQLVLEPSNSGISVIRLSKNTVVENPRDLLNHDRLYRRKG